MRFQRGPVMAYAAVVLIGLLVVVQTLSPDVSAFHRVPRTLSGQADFTVVPPEPAPDVSGVSTIPSTAPDGSQDDDQDDSAGPDDGADAKPEPAPSTAPAEQPDAPSSDEPTEPGEPGDDEGDATPPTLVPSVGPIPGIMAPLLWPFVAEEDARPVDEAVPMFLRQLIAADAGIPVEELPLEDPEGDRGPDGATDDPKKPDKDSGTKEPKTDAEQVIEDACELTAAIAEDVKPLPGASEAPEPDATPECGEACVEPKTPVGSSPAAAPEASTDSDPESDESDDESSQAPEPEKDAEQDGTDDKTCTEKSVQ